MSDATDKPRVRRRATRPGPERPYIDPTPDDEPDVDTKAESRQEEWLRAQKPPHHG